MRLGTYRIIVLGFLMLLALGLFYTQVARGGYYNVLSAKNSIRLISQDPYRGRILDRNQRVMVDNILSFDAVVVPQELKHKDAIFEKLGGFLKLSRDDVWRKYDRGYVNPFTPVVIARGIAKESAIEIEEAKWDMPGVSVDLNARRYYPFGATAAHALGYVGEIDKSRITKMKEYGYDLKDKVGYGGIEQICDLYLRGERGGEQIEVDSVGRQVRLLGYKPPRYGSDVQISLDLEIQQVADRLLQGRSGAVVLMDASNGEVLVMASAPTFDPNVFADRADMKSLNYYLTSDESPLVNRAAVGQFPPGSVFKVVTAAAALRAKSFAPSLTFECRGKLKVGDRYFKCWAEHGSQDFFQAMGHSCDVYFYHMGFWAGSDMISQAAHEFGLGIPTGAETTQEAAGFIPNRLWKRLKYFENWYDGDTANFSIGQGFVLTTPLQLCRMMAAVANGGFLVTPHLTRAVNGAPVSVAAPKKIKIPDEDLDMIRQALRYPVQLEDGTAHNLDISGLEICAKTGTAQVTGKASHGWVAGFFPLSKPRYAFCILLEFAGSSHEACALGQELFAEAQRRGKLS